MTTEAQHQTVTALLHEQHERVERMFDELVTAQGQHRAELFDCLRATLAVHETAEEIVVHPVARQFGPAAERVVDERLAEEDEAKTVLAELEKLGTSGSGFDAKFSSFQRAALDHAQAEERDLFPILEQHCDAAELERLAARVRAAEELAPTHPHPHAPNTRLGNLVAGPFAAMVDKVRDHLHQR